MNRISLRAGLHFWLKGREYMVKKHLAKGDWQIVEVTTEVISTIKETALIQLLFRGELKFEPRLSSTRQGKKPEYLKADFTQIPEELREEAKRKYQYINRVIELNINSKNQASLQPIIDQVSQQLNDLGAPSWITLYRWLKTYLKSGQDIRSLIPRHQAKGDYRPKLKPEVIAIINRAITQVYLTPRRPDIADVYDEVIRQIRKENQNRQVIGMEPLKIPHRSTVYRAVSNLDPSEVAVGRYGKRKAAQMYNPVSRGPRPTRPLERVEIDHTKLPLFVVDTESRMPIGTPWLTSAVDKYSACQEAEKVDIVALALAKEKIQKIVEQEWKKTKKGKTRQSMARWLGIGRDGLIKEENSSAKIPEQPEIGREIESTESRESKALVGISDLDSALSKKKKKAQESPPKPDAQLSPKESEFQPDLTGWDVTYGLPK